MSRLFLDIVAERLEGANFGNRREAERVASILSRIHAASYEAVRWGETRWVAAHPADRGECGRCGEGWFRSDLVRVQTTRAHWSLWCPHCREEHAFEDEWNGRQYASNYWSIGETVDGRVIAIEAHEGEAFLQRDGRYADEPEEEEDPIPQAKPACHREIKNRWASEIPRGAVRFGVELEANLSEPDWPGLLSVLEAAGFLAERDGSLDDEEGVEIIGPPLAFEDVQARWEPVLAELKRQRGRSWNMAAPHGIHVSMPVSGFSRLGLVKFANFIEGHPDLFARIAGRETSYAQFGNTGWDILRRSENGDRGKYCAVNLLGWLSKNRVEVRIFRGTLKPEGLQRCVETCEAVRQFVTGLPIRHVLSEAGKLAFLSFVTSNRKRYPNLFTCLNKTN